MVEYENGNMQEIGKFTLDMALSMQEKLGLGEFMYNEMKMMKVTKLHYHQQPNAQNNSLF